MPTVGHVALGAAVGAVGLRAAGARGPRPRVVAGLVALGALALLPDLDFFGNLVGIPQDGPLGHRGAAHSLVAAALAGLVLGLAGPLFGVSRRRAAVVVALIVASHGVLDLFSQGDLGVALLWPFSDARLLAPWQPIPAISFRGGLLTLHNLGVAAVELALLAPVWVPALALVASPSRAATPSERDGTIRTSGRH